MKGLLEWQIKIVFQKDYSDTIGIRTEMRNTHSKVIQLKIDVFLF